MKKNNTKRILLGVGRIIIRFILCTCVSILFIYLLIGDYKVFEALFSSGKTTEIILLISLIWFFGNLVGAFIVSVEFIALIAKRNIQLEDKRAEINRLKKKIDKASQQ